MEGIVNKTIGVIQGAVEWRRQHEKLSIAIMLVCAVVMLYCLASVNPAVSSSNKFTLIAVISVAGLIFLGLGITSRLLVAQKGFEADYDAVAVQIFRQILDMSLNQKILITDSDKISALHYGMVIADVNTCTTSGKFEFSRDKNNVIYVERKS